MLLIIFLATAALGAAAGWFLAFWLVIALTAACVGAIIWLNIPTGSTEGSWIGALTLPVSVFLIAMWSAYAVSSGTFAGIAFSPDWSSIKKFFFK